MAKNLDAVLEALEAVASNLSDVAEALRDQAAADLEAPAGAGEVEAPEYDGIDDDDEITMRSGDLRQVIDAYRKLVRFARNGKIPTQEERMKGHAAVKKVKHLIRKPHR